MGVGDGSSASLSAHPGAATMTSGEQSQDKMRPAVEVRNSVHPKPGLSARVSSVLKKGTVRASRSPVASEHDDDANDSCTASSALEKVEDQSDEGLLACPSGAESAFFSPPDSDDEDAAGWSVASSKLQVVTSDPGSQRSRSRPASATTPSTPHLEAWKRAGGGLGGERIRSIIQACKTAKPNTFLKNFDLANNYSTNGSVRGFEHLGQQTMPAETIQASAAIFEHRDFQELQDVDVDVVTERRLQAEKYLTFEVVEPTMSLMFDARKFAVAAPTAGVKKITTKKPSIKMRKKARALPNFASGADAYAHTSLGRAHQTHKKGLYHKLKNQVKQQKKTLHLGDLIAASNVDYPSSELLLQRAFLLLAETFGPHDKRTQPTLFRLRDCYLGQGFDKEEDAKELMDNPVKHIARITQRLGELDTGVRAMKHMAAVNVLDRNLVNAGRRAKERMQRRSLKEQEYDDLVKAQQLLRPNTAPASLSVVSTGGADPHTWFTSDRLSKRQTNAAVAVSAAMGVSVQQTLNSRDDTPEQTETIRDILTHIERADYVQVSEHSRVELSKCIHNPPMMDIFHSSLVNMRHFPHISDFQVRVKLQIDGDVIIGDTLVVRYEFMHRLKPHKLHSSKDWIGLFLLPKKQAPAPKPIEAIGKQPGARGSGSRRVMFTAFAAEGREEGKDPEKGSEITAQKPVEEHSKLMLWKFLTQPHNIGDVKADYILEEGREYMCQYFISCSECAVAKTKVFRPRFPRAALQAPESVTCGEELRVRYMLDYRYRTHSTGDYMGIFPHDQPPTGANCVMTKKLPPSNEGTVIFHTGILVPGTYKIAVFLERHNDQVIGTSSPVTATIESVHKAHKRSIQQRDISVCLMGRWDMENMEMAILLERVAPKLKQFCDDHFCALNIVNLEEQLNVSGMADKDDVYRVMWYIDHCHPFFLFCIGDQVSQDVEDTELDLSRVNLTSFPWLRKVPRMYSGLPTLTELMLEACFRVPMLMDPDMASYNQFYFAEMNVRSKRHPYFNKKGVMEALAGLNHSRVRTKQIKRDILHQSKYSVVSEYDSELTLGSSMLDNLMARLTDAYPSDEAVSVGDFVGMLMDCELETHRYSFDPDFEPCRYIQHTKLNGAFLFNPSSAKLSGAISPSNSLLAGTRQALTPPREDDRLEPKITVAAIAQPVKEVQPVKEAQPPSPIGASRASIQRSSMARLFLNAAGNQQQQQQSQGAGPAAPSMPLKPLSLPELLDRYVRDGEPRHKPLILVDRPGSGVTSVLTYWLQSYAARSQVLLDTLPQYGPCLSRMIVMNETTHVRQLVLYVDCELISHRLDTSSLIYYILYSMKISCTSLVAELPDPNVDMVPVFFDWLNMVKNEQVVLLLDGLDYMPNRSEDPLDWLPLSLQPNVRIIGTALPIGRVVYACDAEARRWTVVRRKSELSCDHKEAIVHSFLYEQGKGVLREWLLPFIKSDKMSAQGVIRTHLQELLAYIPQVAGLKAGLNAKMAGGGTGGGEDEAAITDFKAKVQELVEVPDVATLVRARIRREVAACPLLKDVLCLLRVAERGLSELELVTALLRHQENDSELAMHRRKMGPAFVAPGHEAWGGENGDMLNGTLRQRPTKIRRSQDAVTKRFNLFRREQWIGIHTRLMQGQLLARKVMGLYMLKDTNVQRGVDACFFETDNWRMPYFTTLVDTFHGDLPSMRKATELGFLLYRSLRTAVKIENAANAAAAAAAAAAPPGPGTVMKQQAMRTSINKLMDKLFDVLTDLTMFSYLNKSFRRSIFNEYMYQTGVKDTDIYAKILYKFEQRYGITGKNVHGPKHYQLCVVPDPTTGLATQGNGPPKQPVPLSLEGLSLLLKLSNYFFHHIRLYDAGQELAESALLILMESRLFDASMADDSQKLYLDPKNITLVIKTVHALAKMYMIRFLAFYEDRVSHARTTEVNHPAIYSTYRALLERTPRPRNKMTPFRTNYELFSVTIEEEKKEEKEGRQGQVKKEPGELTYVDMASVAKAQRAKLLMDPTKLQARFQILDQIMEKMGGMLEQGQAQQLQAILRLHYPLVYEAWMDLSGRYQNTPFAKAQMAFFKSKRGLRATAKRVGRVAAMMAHSGMRRNSTVADNNLANMRGLNDFMTTRPVDRQMMFKTTIGLKSMRSPKALLEAGLESEAIWVGNGGRNPSVVAFNEDVFGNTTSLLSSSTEELASSDRQVGAKLANRRRIPKRAVVEAWDAALPSETGVDDDDLGDSIDITKHTYGRMANNRFSDAKTITHGDLVSSGTEREIEAELSISQSS